MKPDLNATALFVKVIEYKSFTEASKRLGIPISTISRKVAELEKSLNIRLIERSTRSLRLTDIGQDYFQYCRRGLDEFEAGIFMINNKQSEVIGTLRVSIPPNIADVLVAPIICNYQKTYPKTKINILVTERYVNLIEDGVDIALRVGELQDSNMIARCLLNYRHLLVASPQYLADMGDPQTPDELNEHQLLTFSGWHEPTVWEFFNHQTAKKIPVESYFSINELAGLQYAAENHQGITNLPAITCTQALKQGKLVEVMKRWQFAPTMLSAVYPSKRNTSRLVKLFMESCIQYLDEHSLYTGIE
ncbi:Transcriptional regulator, LysR family [hydrothermal vent metagenome]|uniref:Transcriptional regulator, LysR family n=1 Tax=hydrothermal vent metagenome TaxID=652676 RepID=A0A3B0YG86_9ZZZZ